MNKGTPEGFAMYRMDRSQSSASRQSGTTLVVALLLVLLATLLGLFAVNVGLFGQRTSANDVRARLVQQAAEAGLSQGAEYFRNNRALFADPTTSSSWQLCDATDTSFPCGTVEQCPGKGFSDSKGNTSTSLTQCTGDLKRRGNMYRYIGGAGYDVNGNNQTSDTIDDRSLPLTGQMSLMPSVGTGYAVNYGVGALLCMVKTPAASTDPTECTTDINSASAVKVMMLTAVGSIPGETASTTLSTGIGVHSVLFSPTNKPPVVAAGSVDITGGLQVVTNPNSGGVGVPVSVWTRKSVDKTGTPNTCYFDDFVRDQKNNASPGFEDNSDGTTSTVITCDTCECSSSISYQNSGNNPDMGIDILEVSNTPVIGTSACTNALYTAGDCKANANVKLPNSSGVYEFPCDMFQYVFGVQAWEDDTSPVDGFCETRKMTTDFTPADGSALPSGGIGVDEAFLYNNATKIIPGTLHPQGWIEASKLDTNCTSLSDSSTSAAAGGLIWVQYGETACSGGTGAAFPTGLQIGTPDLPVVVVADGNVDGTSTIGNFHARMFGLLFVRAPDTPLDPSLGGSASGNGGDLFMNAGSVIYGSVVVQGHVKKGNGTASIVYNKTVLENLLTETSLNPFAPVPASWTDRYAY
jgi:hypothetical protein